MAGGECRVFVRPEYVVLGKTRYDQHVVDNFVESGVGGCGWQRPEPRPASLDAVPGQRAAPVAAPKKRSLFRRIKERVIKPVSKPVPEPAPSPFQPVPPLQPAPPPRVEAPEPLPPKPVDPVERLLHPKR